MSFKSLSNLWDIRFLYLNLVTNKKLTTRLLYELFTSEDFFPIISADIICNMLKN